MKYIAEYHLGRGGYVSREFDSKEEMDKTVMSFMGSRKGCHSWQIAEGQTATVPLENVSMILSAEIEEKVEEETEEE